MEQDVATLNAQLVEKQTIQSENDRLKLQLSSLQTQSQIEQKRADEERLDNTKIQIYDLRYRMFALQRNQTADTACHVT